MITTLSNPPDKEELYSLRNAIQRQVNASAKAWERGNNSGDSRVAKECTELERAYADEAWRLIKKFCPGVTMDWPGLYPAYQVPGKGEEYTLEGMLTSFFDLPRNYFKKY